jgi:hypothetical protein
MVEEGQEGQTRGEEGQQWWNSILEFFFKSILNKRRRFDNFISINEWPNTTPFREVRK